MAGAAHSLSDSTLRKLEDQLTCPVCLSDYNDPRVLQCIHTFCRQCLEDLAKRERDGQTDELLLVIECPVCRKETKVGAVDELQTAFHIQSLFEIRKDLEKSWEQATFQKPDTCEAHRMEVEFYCKTCSTLLCRGCTHGAHKLHSFDEISPAAGEVTRELEVKLNQFDLKVTHIEEAVGEIETSCERAHKEEKEMEEAIRESIRKAHQLLDERENELIKELREMMQQKVHNLSVRKNQLQQVETQLKICREAVTENLQQKSPTLSLMLSKTLVPMIEDANSAFQETVSSVRHAANDIAFFADESVLEPLREFGDVYVKVPHAEHCLIEGDGLSKAKVGKTAEVKLSLYNQHNLEIDMELGAHTVTSDFYSSTVESDIVKCSVEKLDKNQCAVKYIPTEKGPHKLDVEVLGQPVKGSPFHVTVKAPLELIGPEPLHVTPGLSLPWGLTVDNTGRLFVSVSGRKEVMVLSSRSGEKISTAVKRGFLVSALEEPTGVALDRDGNLIVADFRLSHIHRVAPDGNIVQSVGSSGSKTLEFTYPSSLAVHPLTGKIYVTEWKDNDRVQVLNHDFSFYKKFGCSGTGQGEFQCPSGIAFDSGGDVYVTDCNNARIQIFTCEGDYIREFGTRGRKEGKLGLPMGICMDHTSKVLYVTDVLNHRVSLFTTQGQFLRSFGRYGTGPGEFNKPQGIAVDEFRFVYVSDTLNNRVQVF